MKYPCQLSPTGTCKYAGNKYYNYRFVQGMANFCREPSNKRFVADTTKCPLSITTKED
jgi:hypothetical protein